MKLNEIGADARKKRKRVGRGIGSGTGKTAGRGHKGQKSRSGVALKAFEGGQQPIYRRLPKRGFTNIFRVFYQVVNIADLQKAITSGSIKKDVEINREVLLKAGLIRKTSTPIKLLGKGTIQAKIGVEVDAASVPAIKAVEEAEGTVKIITQPSQAA